MRAVSDRFRSIVNGPQTAHQAGHNRSMVGPTSNIRAILIRNLQALRSHAEDLGELPKGHSDRQWHAHTKLPRSTIRHIEAGLILKKSATYEWREIWTIFGLD